MRLNYDSGAAVTTLPIAIAGNLPLEKCGEFRDASGATIPNLLKIKMKSTDESGIERTLRGNITEVSKPLLSAAEVSKRWDSLLFEDGGLLLERSSLVALELRAILAKHKVWSRRGRLYREGNLYNAYVRTGDVTQELAPVEPAEESCTRMEVDDVQRDEQEESEDQLEELEARQPTELERQRHSQTNYAQHRRQTNKELAKQEQYGPRIYSDFFYMCEEGVSTPMLALRFSRSGRMAATALELKGLTQYGVKFFAGFIQQTGVRMFINKSDGEPAHDRDRITTFYSVFPISKCELVPRMGEVACIQAVACCNGRLQGTDSWRSLLSA